MPFCTVFRFIRLYKSFLSAATVQVYSRSKNDACLRPFYPPSGRPALGGTAAVQGIPCFLCRQRGKPVSIKSAAFFRAFRRSGIAPFCRRKRLPPSFSPARLAGAAIKSFCSAVFILLYPYLLKAKRPQSCFQYPILSTLGALLMENIFYC